MKFSRVKPIRGLHLLQLNLDPLRPAGRVDKEVLLPRGLLEPLPDNFVSVGCHAWFR